MFKNRKRKFPSLKLRVSYDELNETIYIDSKDKRVSKGERSIPLIDPRVHSEQMVRELLAEADIRPESYDRTYPDELTRDELTGSKWDEFPVGMGAFYKPVGWNPNESSNLLITGNTGTGKSMVQRNIMLHCMANPDKWRILAFAPHGYEFAKFRKHSPVVLGVANGLEDGVEACRYLRNQMLARYKKMEELGVGNYRDIAYSNLREAPPAIIFFVDDADYLISPSYYGALDKRENGLRAEAMALLTEISRLGSAAGIHLVLSSTTTEYLANTEILENMNTRIVMGRVDSAHSTLLLGTDEAATRYLDRPRGRAHIQTRLNGETETHRFQTAKIPEEWYVMSLATEVIDTPPFN